MSDDRVNLIADRLNKGLSSREAAKKIGVSQAVLLNAETGRRPKRASDAKAIADFYEYRVTDIWPVDPVGQAA